MSLKDRASKLKKDIPAVYLSLKDKDTPLAAKLIAGIAVVYALSPVDLIPDFIPVLGYFDDVLLLPALIAAAVRLIPREVWERSCLQAGRMWENGKPKRWYYALPVILVWILILFIIAKAIFF